LIPWIRWTFKSWVHPPGRFVADKASGKGDLSDNLNAAAPCSWNTYQDALTISSMSEMYPTAAIRMFWAQHSFYVACRCWLLFHISKKLWILAFWCNFLPSMWIIISESFSVFISSDTALLPAKIPWLAPVNYHTMTFFTNGLACGFSLPPADNISPKGKLGLYSDTIEW
jgi:hypothetical protein